MSEGKYRGSREEGGEAFHQQRRVLCFSLSLLPLSIVLLSICFLPSSSYLSDRVTLSGLGLTSANRQGHAGRKACEASCTHCTVSFLFVLRHGLCISAVSHSVSPDEDGSESVLCAFLCVRSASSGWPLMPRQASPCPLPRKTAQALDVERSYPAASQDCPSTCVCVCECFSGCGEHMDLHAHACWYILFMHICAGHRETCENILWY